MALLLHFSGSPVKSASKPRRDCSGKQNFQQVRYNVWNNAGHQRRAHAGQIAKITHGIPDRAENITDSQSNYHLSYVN